MAVDKIKIERGSGNVFADLGRQDAEAHLLKAKLVARIDGIIRRRGLKQVEAAKLLGLSQPDLLFHLPPGIAWSRHDSV